VASWGEYQRKREGGLERGEVPREKKEKLERWEWSKGEKRNGENGDNSLGKKGGGATRVVSWADGDEDKGTTCHLKKILLVKQNSTN